LLTVFAAIVLLRRRPVATMQQDRGG
jgi:hypothetical protein